MNVILREDMSNLGRMGEIVTVKDGYARNYLLPRSKAYFATEGAIKRLEIEKKQYTKKLAKEKDKAEILSQQLSDLQVSVSMKVGEEGRLYGSVTNQMVAQELSLRGFEIDRRSIIIEDQIKTLGVFDVKVKLHPEVITTLKVWVISEE
jgi:large subunit ribosomal protein L9